MTEWKGDRDHMWWQDAAPLEAVCIDMPPTVLASSSGAPATAHSPAAAAANADKSHATPDPNKAAVKPSKKYSSEPPARKQTWFEFLVSSMSGCGVTVKVRPIMISPNSENLSDNALLPLHTLPWHSPCSRPSSPPCGPSTPAARRTSHL